MILANSENSLIVVPTRNRLDAALSSLESLKDLANHAGISVLVSDNSDEKLKELQKFCNSYNFRYTFPPAVMSMTDHWNWILTEHEYKTITILTDRSYLLQDIFLDALQICLDGDIAVTYESAFFSQKPLPFFNLSILSSKIRSGARFKIACDQLLNMTESGQVCWALPRLLNSVIPRSHMDRMMAKYPRLLSSISPDFEFAYKYIYMFDDVMFIDDIGMLRHSGKLSNGAAWNMGVENEASRDFAKRSMPKRFTNSPLPDTMNAFSGIAHEFNKISADLKSERRVTKDVLERQLALLEIRKMSRSNKNIYSRINTLAALLNFHPNNSVRIGLNKGLSDIDCSKIKRDREKISFYDLV